ncbi:MULTISPECIES: carboxylesterase [unclassified Polynucleobacter]|uniref:alpha/beta hydrolase n=1 Tax=unclassified Polynucleobacter TaxID=2640945 RepID=UPI001F43C405|nr:MULTISPECIES: alpha/beta hydrolase [unclassified Polynucleobacter]MCE7527491.1 alpha/beta hydrolase [Polynucleobacter sp. IMCC 30228]MCE7530702.1 alpha/beta hydrolase [Polynucleobacter sp. IMCC 29146]
MNTIAATPSSSPLIVLFHGLSSSPLELSYLANVLRKSGFRVETPTFNGYNFGDHAGNWNDWLNEAVNYVSNLQIKESLPISLGGVSLGATLALGVGSRLDNIHAILCLSTTLNYNGWAIPWYRIFAKLGIWLGLGGRFKYKERDPFGVKNIQIRAYIKKAMSNHQISEIGGSYMTLNHIYQANQLCSYVKKNLAYVTAATLTIHAVDDEIAHPNNVELLNQSISSELKRSIYLGNSYHMITVDNERETVAYESIAFLKETYDILSNSKIRNKIISPELQRFLRVEKSHQELNKLT